MAVHRRSRGAYPPPRIPPPFLPFQCLRPTAKILLQPLRCQEDLRFKNFGPPSAGAIGGSCQGGGGGSQPPLPPIAPLSNTSLEPPPPAPLQRLGLIFFRAFSQ